MDIFNPFFQTLYIVRIFSCSIFSISKTTEERKTYSQEGHSSQRYCFMFIFSLFLYGNFLEAAEQEEGHTFANYVLKGNGNILFQPESQEAKNYKRKKAESENGLEGKRDTIQLPSFKKLKKEVQLEEEDNSLTTISPILSQEPFNLQVFSNGSEFAGSILPSEIIIYVFSKLSIPEIYKIGQVCKLWFALTEDRFLWKELHQTMLYDYPEAEATKETAKKHYLRVLVNTLFDLEKISFLVIKYHLNKGHPFKAAPYLLLSSIENDQLRMERIAQDKSCYFNGHLEELEERFGDLSQNSYYEDNSDAIYNFIEKFAQMGCKAAVWAKISSMLSGRNGYKRKSRASRVYIEDLAKRGHRYGIKLKIQGMEYARYGYKYEKGYSSFHNYLEELIQQGYLPAIEKKVQGLIHGFYGYQKNTWIADKYEKDDFLGIVTSLFKEREHNYDCQQAALYLSANKKQCPFSRINYLKDEKALKELRKSILGPAYKYQKHIEDLPNLKTWVEEESLKGNRWAQYLKAQGLKYGMLGFEQDLEAASRYIWQNSLPY